MTESPSLAPPLSDLEISSEKPVIGKGTFGIVKMAESQKTKAKYALKIVDTKNLQKDDIYCLEREMDIHRKLDHPNIIRFFGHHWQQKELIMVLEYASNGNLFAYIRRKKRLSETEAFRLFYQTASALGYLHKNDILHRDVKPENLLLDEKNNIKLCDFGWSTQGIALKRNTFCGTYEYMSPEVVFKKPYNENIDVWALGILLYEMVHGRSPYRAKNLKDITHKMLNDNKISFSNDISPDLSDLITNILRLNPLERLTLRQIFEHQWVRRMCSFLDYKELEDREEKILTRGTSLSFKSDEKNKNDKMDMIEKQVDNSRQIFKSKACENEPMRVLTKTKTLENDDGCKIHRNVDENRILRAKTFQNEFEGVPFEKIREKAKERRNHRIFESVCSSDCPKILTDMENLLKNMEISTQNKTKKRIFLL